MGNFFRMNFEIVHTFLDIPSTLKILVNVTACESFILFT